MNDRAWSKLWSLVGLASFGFGLAATLVARGAGAAGESFVKLGQWAEASVVVSFPVLFCLLFLTTIIAYRFAQIKANAPWPERIPLAILDRDDVYFDSIDMRVFQCGMLFAYLALPSMFLIIIFIVFINGSVYYDGVKLFSGLEQFHPPALQHERFSGQYRFGSAHGPSYYPTASPVCYTIFLAIAVTFQALLAAKLLSRRRQDPALILEPPTSQDRTPGTLDGDWK